MKFPLLWTYRFAASPSDFLDWCKRQLPNKVGTGARTPVSVSEDGASVVLRWGSGNKTVIFRCTIDPAPPTSRETGVSVYVDTPGRRFSIWGATQTQMMAVNDLARFHEIAQEAGFKLLSPTPPWAATPILR